MCVPAAMSEKQAAVQRIVASKRFAKAPLLSAFLLHVSRRALEDRAERISEYEIGVVVFQRSEHFDPRQDNIVRTYARHLRQRLQEYYEAEGLEELVRVEMPKGTYVPAFRSGPLQAVEAEASADGVAREGGNDQAGLLASQGSTSGVASAAVLSGIPFLQFNGRFTARRAWWFAWRAGLAAMLLAGYSLALWRFAEKRVPSPPHASAAVVEQHSALHPLWAELFLPHQGTLVIPGDVGFVILQQANHRTFSLAEYLKWFSPEGADNHMALAYLKDETYTSVLNLEIVSSLERLPEAIANGLTVRATRDVRLDDLRDGNAILLGSTYSNPWEELFKDKLNFQVVSRPDANRFWIVNQHPVGKEAGIYESATTSTTHRTYAVVAFLPNLNGSGHVLLLQGLDAAGTQAAADMLFSGEGMQGIVQDALHHSGASRGFELLLEVNSLDANSHATRSQVIASRFRS